MASEINILLDELEARIEKLKIAYEQYFLGIEKLEPIKDRKDVARIVRHIQTATVTNTALRFRLNSLNQRFMSYQNYWNRIIREIEAGTYHRDVARVERGLKRRGIDTEGLSRARHRGELEAALTQALREQEPTGAASGSDGAQNGRKRQQTLPPPLPPEAQSTADDRMRKLYRAYVAAKRRTGESVEGITYDRLVHTLQKQIPAIRAKTGCRQVDFKIEIRGGKTILKVVPRN